MRSFKYALFVLAVMMCQIGCKSGKNANLNTSTNLQNVTVPGKSAGFVKMDISRGGGVTGIWKGYTLYPSGKVEHWQEYGATKSVLWSGKSEPQKILEFKLALDDAGILSENIQQYGNMTTIVKLQTADTSYVWAWHDTNGIPSSLINWHKAVTQYCRGLAPGR